ncbi:endonuclease III domain-containing protein [Lacticaseibacillus salsurivasis]|uniref:endonuclease III domain-containing protein n=1 Tax=Lacticaseibacillus salsurivasis TaxID=3081441 RepID=UPI0030C6F6BF
MPSVKLTLPALYHTLAEALGPSGWWPAESKYEILVGAILVQNTNWRNVDRSLTNLRQGPGFDPAALAELKQADWIELIRPSGFYQNKSKALMALFQFLQPAAFDLAAIGRRSPAQLRQQLLALPGIGNETADAMRLYAFDQPTFIADLYARRLFGWLGQPFPTYAKLAQVTPAVNQWPLADAQEFHGLIDNFGKTVKNQDAFDASFLSRTTLNLDPTKKQTP